MAIDAKAPEGTYVPHDSDQSAGGQVALPATPPGQVVAAVVLTWVAMGSAAGGAMVATPIVLYFGNMFAPVFGVSSVWWVYVVGAAAATVCACAGVSVLALFVLRGVNAARWGLITACALMVIAATLLASLVLPVLVALAALVIIVLLLLPAAQAWTTQPRPIDTRL